MFSIDYQQCVNCGYLNKEYGKKYCPLCNTYNDNVWQLVRFTWQPVNFKWYNPLSWKNGYWTKEYM